MDEVLMGSLAMTLIAHGWAAQDVQELLFTTPTHHTTPEVTHGNHD
jgi:hypothetical protein